MAGMMHKDEVVFTRHENPGSTQNAYGERIPSGSPLTSIVKGNFQAALRTRVPDPANAGHTIMSDATFFTEYSGGQVNDRVAIVGEETTYKVIRAFKRRDLFSSNLAFMRYDLQALPAR